MSSAPDTEKNIHPGKKTGLLILLVFVILIGTSGAMILAYQKGFEGKIYRGVHVADVDLSGLTSTEALQSLQQISDQIEEEGYAFEHQDKKAVAPTTVASLDSLGSAYDVVTFDMNPTVDAAYKIGRGKNWWTNTKEQIQSFFGKKNLTMNFFFNEEKMEEYLREQFGQFDQPAINASLTIDESKSFIISPAKQGTVLDYEKAIATTRTKIQNLKNDATTITTRDDYPTVTEDNIETAKKLANNLLEQAPLTVTAEDKNFPVDQGTFASWLDFAAVETEDSLLYGGNTDPRIGLKKDITEKFLETIGEKFNVKAKNGKFERQEDGNMIALEDSQAGKEIDIPKSIVALEDQIIREGMSQAKLVVTKTDPKVSGANINELNIVEKIGEGRSNFAGSPKNRIHNIKHGTAKIHGNVIAPDEEFSLLEVLKPFTLEDGWREELVIKGNETKPEVAGGACQFGTTLFRGALNSGLDITSRRNHSYTVSYYYPIGTDATIYDPAPDLRFINDTGNYILLQTRIEGTELIYEFWGKSDGRKTETTKPETYNWVNPPPRKTIETDTLAPDEVKCTEKAHKGVEARFDYRVTYADGQKHEETFHSKYKAWQEVCLVGKKKEEPKKEEPAPKEPETPTTEEPKQDSPPSNTNQDTTTVE